MQDHYFLIAHVAAIDGDFDTSIINYQRAMKASKDQCDRHAAMAGIQAANAGKQMLKTKGWASRPTQSYGVLLKELTTSLPCIKRWAPRSLSPTAHP